VDEPELLEAEAEADDADADAEAEEAEAEADADPDVVSLRAVVASSAAIGCGFVVFRQEAEPPTEMDSNDGHTKLGLLLCTLIVPLTRASAGRETLENPPDKSKFPATIVNEGNWMTST
jgi:hypothetical protein